MINILDVSIFSIGIFLLAYLSITIVKLRRKTIKLTEKLVQNNIDNNTLFEKITELKAEQNAKNIAETQGFVKFLSESRQMAFDYIEVVQKAIANHILVVETKNIEEIEKSILNIKSLLPEQDSGEAFEK